MSKGTEEIAVFGGGCFWCTEAIFSRLRGVHSVVPGYAGGTTPNPTYAQVCEGDTGHAEVTKITFDPNQIPYEDLLDIFWHVHDPTTMNQQGADVGTQYRSIILYTSDDQKKKAEAMFDALETSKEFSDPIVTTIEPLEVFYDTEDYHQNYFENNKNQPYCQIVIAPKVKKFLEKYGKKVADA